MKTLIESDAEDLLETGKAIQKALDQEGNEASLRDLANAYHAYYEYQKQQKHKHFHGKIITKQFLSIC